MQASAGRIIAIVVILLVVLSLMGPCLSTGPPAETKNVARQVELINQSFDALEEEVTAAQAPNHGVFFLFILSVLVPLGAAVWLLWRAECSAVHHDQILRAMVQVGFAAPVMNAYLRKFPDQLPGPNLPVIRRPMPRASKRSRRHRRRWRRRSESDNSISESTSRLKHYMYTKGD